MPQALAAHDLTFAELEQALAGAASNAPVGTINGEKQLFNLKVAGQPSNADGFRPLIVTWRNGAPVRLNDVANVSDSVEDLRAIGSINGKNAVVIAIQRQPDANTIEVVQRVRDLLPTFRSQIPPSIELTPLFDRSVAVKESLHDVQLTMLLTIVLVVAVIFLFLRKASAHPDSRHCRAAVDRRHLWLDGAVWLQHQQHFPAGANPVRRLCGGRCHRRAGKHRSVY
jgi:HAE1 family hydrophobic/amphiphilic exporter-1